jgi:hypothetical protein
LQLAHWKNEWHRARDLQSISDPPPAPTPTPKTELLVSGAEALSTLQDRIAKVAGSGQINLEISPILLSYKSDAVSWRKYNIELLRQLFSTPEIGYGVHTLHLPRPIDNALWRP